MDHVAALLAEIETFIADAAMAESTFGRLAVNDGKFVGRLRDRGNITFATAQKVRGFIQARRAAGLPAKPPVQPVQAA
jgi:hypothetical protein